MNQRVETSLTVIKPASGWSALNLRDLWKYRELIGFLIWRDLKVRYRQTLLGVSWAVLIPFLNMVVFSILFGEFGKIPSDGVPYPIFAFVAQLPWQLFSKALNDASRSLVANSNMITKVYFPRIILPISAVFSGLADFAIAFLVLIGLMIYYGVTPTGAVWTLPLYLILTLITALGVGFWLSALNVLYRDVGYVMHFLTQFWMFISPVAYPASMVTTGREFYALNPMAGAVEGFRWALLGTPQSIPTPTLLLSVVVSLAVLVSGMFYFRRMERQFADRV